jgi:DNA primase
MSDLDINDRVLAELRAAADIVEVISPYTALRKAGRNFKGLCPFHQEKTPSFVVDRDKGLYHCFGCGAGGDVIHFVRQIERLDFPEAVEHLAGRFGVEVPRRQSRQRDETREKLAEAMAAAHRFYAKRLAEEPNPAAEYLTRRSVPKDIWKQFGLGFAPDSWDELARGLSGFPVERLVEAGLLQPGQEGKRPYDRFRNRLLFPIRDEKGRVVGFGGRSLGNEEPKYLNSPETPLFLKSRTLYGYFEAREAIRQQDRAILVEGYFDHLALVRAGFRETVATMGTALTANQGERLRRSVETVFVCYDGDPAGRSATGRAIPVLLAAGLRVRVVAMPPDSDPDDVLSRSGPRPLAERVEASTAFLDWWIEDRQIGRADLAPEEKSARVREIREGLEAIPDRVLRFEYVRELARRAGVPSEVLWKRAVPPRSGQAPGTPAAPPLLAPVSVPQMERRVLQLILSGQEDGSHLLREVEVDFFSDRRAAEVFEALRKQKKSGNALDFSGLAPHLTGVADLAFVSGLLLDEASEPSAGEWEYYAKYLKRFYLERESKKLSATIERAQSAGDLGEVSRLSLAKQEISRQIRDLKKSLKTVLPS